MDYANQQAETEYSFDPAVGLAESANDDDYISWQASDDEIDIWARRALAANGFGDY